MTTSTVSAARWISALCLGAAVPLLISGRGLFFVLIGVGSIAGIAALGSKAGVVIGMTLSGLRKIEGWAVILLLALWAVAAVATIDPAKSPMIFGLMAGVAALLATFANGYAVDPVGRNRALAVMITAAWLAAILILIGVHIWPQLFEFLRQRDVQSASGVIRFLKAYGAVIPLMTFVLLWAGHRLGGGWRWMGLLYIPLGIYLVYLLNNKAATLAYVGGVTGAGLCFLLSRVSAKTAWTLGAGILALIAVVLTLLFLNLPDLPYTKASKPTLPTWMVDAHRQVIWSFVLESAGDRPWFGWGLGTAGRLSGAKDIIPGFTVEFVPSHPHNWVLQVLAESGVFALIALWLVIVLTARHLVRLTAVGHTSALASAAVLGGFLASSLFNFSFFAAWWQVVSALLFALPLSAAWEERKALPGRSPPL